MRALKILRSTPGQVLMVLWTIVVLLPFVLIMILSFRTDAAIFAYPLGVGGELTLENYSSAWSGPPGGTGLAIYLTNSGIIAVAGLLTNLGIGSPAAFFSTRLVPKVRDGLLVLFLVANVVPLVLLIVPVFMTFNRFNLIDSPAALGVVYGIVSMPTTILVLHAFYRDFPQELVEASAVDGLGIIATFARIVLPLSRGAMVGVGIISLIAIWGEAQLGIAILQSATSQSVPIGLLGFRGQYMVALGPIFAGLALASIPIVIVYLVFNRSIAKGISLGGVFR
jgi:ABC-type glycerol-3-phosphate transport system permease component